MPEDIGKEIREGATFAIGSIVALGGVAAAILLLHYMAYQISVNSSINVLGFFNPIVQQWGTFATIFIISAMMAVAIPIITWLIAKFRGGFG